MPSTTFSTNQPYVYYSAVHKKQMERPVRVSTCNRHSKKVCVLIHDLTAHLLVPSFILSASERQLLASTYTNGHTGAMKPQNAVPEFSYKESGATGKHGVSVRSYSRFSKVPPRLQSVVRGLARNDAIHKRSLATRGAAEKDGPCRVPRHQTHPTASHKGVCK